MLQKLISSCLMSISTWIFCRHPTQHVQNWTHGCIPPACSSFWLPCFCYQCHWLPSKLCLKPQWPLILTSPVSPLIWSIATTHRHCFHNIYHIHPSSPFPLLPYGLSSYFLTSYLDYQSVLLVLPLPMFLLFQPSYILSCPRPIILMNNTHVKIRFSFHPAGDFLKKEEECHLSL